MLLVNCVPLDTDAFIEEQMTLQKKSFAGAWENKFVPLEYDAVMQQRRDAVVTIDWEDGTSETKSGAEVYKLIFDSNKPDTECKRHNIYKRV